MEKKSFLMPKLIGVIILLIVAAVLIFVRLLPERRLPVSEPPQPPKQPAPVSVPRPVVPQDKKSRLRKQMEQSLTKKDYKTARKTLEEMQKEYPGYEHLPSLLYRVAMCEKEGGVETGVVEKNLKEVIYTYPNTAASVISLGSLTEVIFARKQNVAEI